MEKLRVGIIGGSGFYSLPNFQVIDSEVYLTPFGYPSSPITRMTVGDVEVLFIARHGEGHRISPSEINSRANMYALKSLGATWCIGISAVGSLREDFEPGQVVVPDQLIDLTKSRSDTFFENGIAAHVGFADPFCPVLSKILGDKAIELDGSRVHRAGTYICMEGPAFSTRAESNMYRAIGASIIGMTALPEAKLARECEIAYCTLAMVTDYDCWRVVEGIGVIDQSVHVQEVLAVFAKNIAFVKEIVVSTLHGLARANPSEIVSSALKGAIMTDPKYISAEVRERLKPLIGKYL